jgi:hypothetical protein
MDTDQKPDSSEASGTRLVAPKSTSRRRLLQAGLGASPAILTLISEPVRAFGANTSVCRSASAFASVAAAQHAGITLSHSPVQSCVGLKPGSWATNYPNWPTGTASQLFSGVFSPGVSVGTNTSPSLKQVLDSTDSTLEMARYFVAAYLNFMSGYTPGVWVVVGDLQAVWPKAVAGVYTPVTGGTPWIWYNPDPNGSPPGLKNWFSIQMPN